METQNTTLHSSTQATRLPSTQDPQESRILPSQTNITDQNIDPSNVIAQLYHSDRPLMKLDSQNQENEANSDQDIIQEWIFKNGESHNTSAQSQFEEKVQRQDQSSPEGQEDEASGVQVSLGSRSEKQEQVGTGRKQDLETQTGRFGGDHQAWQGLENQVRGQVRRKQPRLKDNLVPTNCTNCQSKKAKYRLVNDNSIQLFYCSKCAIKLLQKGYQVEEIQRWENSKFQEMRANILMFMDRLASIHVATQKNIKEIGLGADYSYIQLERDAIESTYEEIGDMLERMKQKELQDLDQMEEEMKLERQKAHLRLIAQLDEVQSMQSTMKEAFEDLASMEQFQVQNLIEDFTNGLIQFHQYKFCTRPIQPQPYDTRLQKLFNSVYDHLLVGRGLNSSEVFYRAGFQSQSPSLGYIDGTIEYSKQPFRLLFPNDDHQDKGQRLHLQDSSRESSTDPHQS